MKYHLYPAYISLPLTNANNLRHDTVSAPQKGELSHDLAAPNRVTEGGCAAQSPMQPLHRLSAVPLPFQGRLKLLVLYPYPPKLRVTKVLQSLERIRAGSARRAVRGSISASRSELVWENDSHYKS